MAKTRFDSATIQKNLTGIDYPANKEDFVDAAHHNDAPEWVISLLEDIPDREYDSATDLISEIAGAARGEKGENEEY